MKATDTSACNPETGFRHTLRDPASGVATTLHVSKEFRFLQIFTGAKATWGTDAVVLEPLSAMSDAYNNHDSLHVISAGEMFHSSYGVSVAPV